MRTLHRANRFASEPVWIHVHRIVYKYHGVQMTCHRNTVCLIPAARGSMLGTEPMLQVDPRSNDEVEGKRESTLSGGNDLMRAIPNLNAASAVSTAVITSAPL